MLILDTVRFWELSRACSIWVYTFEGTTQQSSLQRKHIYMDVYSSRENVKFIHLGELGDSNEVIAAAIDAYFEKKRG